MKRPSGLWILLSAGVLWLSVQDVYCVRATSLKFKSTTTTTTTSTALPVKEHESSEEEVVTTEVNSEGNVTKPTLTGNPQLDYVYDPNLPKELNGYNLADYPFYERVPADIDFKCDGLHDGFYASVVHKCQVYHHCLNGQRYDFLCANYTAFDQTLFNCNFVSNVDCVNSKKFWSRNDELYKTVSTTAPPPIVYNFYTTAPPAYSLTPSPVQQPLPVVPYGFDPVPAEAPIVQRRPILQRRPQPQPPKRTQQFEYYEEDYEEQPRMVYRRKRPRPRPVYYDDDYDDYDDGYHRTTAGRRRRPMKRPMRRNQSRRVLYDDDEDDYRLEGDYGRFDMGGRFTDDDVLPGRADRGNRKETNKNKRRTTAKPFKKRRMDDEYEEEDEYEDAVDTRRSKNDELPRAKAEPKRIQKMNMRRQLSSSADYEDDADETPRSRKNNDRNSNSRKQEGNRAIIKPTTGTLYDKPRVAPRINLPVPKNAAEKFAYKSINRESREGDSEEYGVNESLESSSESTTSTSTTDSVPDKASQRRANYLKRNGNRTETSSRNNERSTARNDDKELPRERNDDGEIQERRADRKQAPVIVKSPLQSRDDLECTKLNNCSKEELLTIQKSSRAKPQKSGKPRVSVFKTPINSQRFHTPDLDDILDGSYDESINEAY